MSQNDSSRQEQAGTTSGPRDTAVSGKQSRWEYGEITLKNRIARAVWTVAWWLFFRTSPRIFYAWRRMILRLFGAKIGRGVYVYPDTAIWAPWNLEMGDGSRLGPKVDCYSVAKIRIEAHAIVSQYSYLCSASHDYEREDFCQINGPITVGEYAWVAADAFVGPGVSIGRGAVCGARSVIVKDIPDWTIWAGNPARYIKDRKLRPGNAAVS
jgi:putative colanic acid biosynthesis acetyltransferase WcaF